jgi:hypothetical protein
MASVGRALAGDLFDNGTESNLLMRLPAARASQGRRWAAHHRSKRRDRFSPTTLGEDDTESGTIYVLRSKSDHPMIAQHRELIHKIGVTGGAVGTRISGAENDATYLLAGVESHRRIQALQHQPDETRKVDPSFFCRSCIRH